MDFGGRHVPEDRDSLTDALLAFAPSYRIVDPRDGEAFVRSITTVGSDGQSRCTEYRFCGALGFGGKFRNNGNCNNTPYVDCYPESETPARLEMIARANARLAEIFAVKPETAEQK